jgi:hypothetical protein
MKAPHAKKRKRAAPSTTKPKRGRPFSHGPDPRRNRKGRTAKPKISPQEVMLAAIMKEVSVTQGGRKTKRPKIAVVLEQQMASAMQGDQSAVRLIATLLRALNVLTKPQKDAADASPSSVHDADKLEAIMKAYDARITKSVKKKGAR